MPDDRESFKRWLVRALQTGTFERMVSCEAGQCTVVEFRLQRIYRIQLSRHTCVVQDREREAIHQRTNGRWRRLGPAMVRCERILLERRTGRLLHSPRLGKVADRATRRRPRRALVVCR